MFTTEVANADVVITTIVAVAFATAAASVVTFTVVGAAYVVLRLTEVPAYARRRRRKHKFS